MALATNHSPRARAERVLGLAVHPKALDRLFELCPEASVRVRHLQLWDPMDHWYERANGKIVPNITRVTEVQIDVPQEGVALAFAECHPEDNYVRRRGIELAFRRALKLVPK